MTRRQKPKALRETDRALYVEALGIMRHACIKAMSQLHPVGDDFKGISEFMQAIDQHQAHFTGDPDHFHIKPAPSTGGGKWCDRAGSTTASNDK